ncbi:MAG: cupin domain-containing protein [Betaproteobacteria bacterium]
MKNAYRDVTAFVTKDGSEIRELVHPAVHGNLSVSFAEAIVRPGATTLLHRHHAAEEIYHITAGSGRMRLGPAEFPIDSGDTIAIAPGTPHNVVNTGAVPLKILCACYPAYADEDTELL